MEEAAVLLSTEEGCGKKFDHFSDELISMITTACFEISGNHRSVTAWCEKSQINFHKLRLTQIPLIWSRFYEEFGLKMEDPLLMQSVSHHVFNTLLVERISSRAPSKQAPLDTDHIDKDEENALRYACGYIPFKLLKKYKTQSSSEKAVQFVTCLTNMAVDADQSEDYEEYTTEWVTKVDRGGLFNVSDQSYQFFKAIEYQVRAQLPKYLISTLQLGLSKEELISTIQSDEDVTFLWTLLSVDVADVNAHELLHEIIELWITLRGFSKTSSWLEQYKRAKQKTTKKSKSLRKELKK